MEDEQFEILPGPAYVRGFLRAYADALNLDSQLVLDEYTSRFDAQPAPSHDASRPARRSSSRQGRRGRRDRRGAEPRILVLSICATIAAALAIWIGAADDETPAAAPDDSSASSLPVTLALTGSGTDGSRVVVRRDGPEGARLFDGRLAPGITRRWTADGALWVRATQPAALRATVNGQTQALAGAETGLVLAASR